MCGESLDGLDGFSFDQVDSQFDSLLRIHPVALQNGLCVSWGPCLPSKWFEQRICYTSKGSLRRTGLTT